MKLRKIGIATLLVWSGAVQAATPQKGVAAIVNGETITLDEVNHAVDQILKSRPLPKESTQKAAAQKDKLYTLVLRDRVKTIVLKQKAKKLGLDKKQEYIKGFKALKQNFLASSALKFLVDKEVTEKTLKAEYDAYVKYTSAKKTYHVAHILMKKESTAEKVLARLGRGEAFKKLASSFSVDPGSKGKGGDLGQVQLEGLVPAFAKTLKAAPAFKKVVPVKSSDKAARAAAKKAGYREVKTRFGWHILKRIGQPKAIKVLPFGTLKPRLKRRLEQKFVQVVLQKLEADKGTKIQAFDSKGLPLSKDKLFAPAQG